MDEIGDFDRGENDKILREVLEKLIGMHNNLGHQLIAVQSVCAYLIAEQCRGKENPLASVQDAVALLSGTGIALADRYRERSLSKQYDSRGATEVFERIGVMAEKTVRAEKAVLRVVR